MQLTNSTSIENNTGLAVHSFNLSSSPHIFKVLYSSMYERKEEAVIRELACNARDALHKVGKFDVPVEITLPTEDAPELIVSDTGVGMSYEEVTRIYPVYGASTKRDNNTDIGGFGYGSKSPFALSPSFTVKTTKEGITTTLSCFLDEGTPKFIPFTSGNVGNSDGTVVSIPINSTDVLPRFTQAINSLFVLWEVKPVIHNAPSRSSLYPNVTLEDHGAWYRLSVMPNAGYRELYVAVGPLIYRVPAVTAAEIYDSVSYQMFKKFLDSGHIIPKFAIGSLELAPSREFIEDTAENGKLIKEYFQNATTSLSERFLDTPENIVSNVYKLFHENTKKLNNTVVWVDKSKIENYLKTVITDYDTLMLGYLQTQFIANTDFIEEAKNKGFDFTLDHTAFDSSECVSSLYRTKKSYYVLDLRGCLDTNWNLKHTISTFSNHVNLCTYSVSKNGSFRSCKVYSYYLRTLFTNNPKIVFCTETIKLKQYVNANNANPDDFIGVDVNDVVAFKKYLEDNKDILTPFEIIDETEIDKAWSNKPKVARAQNKTSTTKASAASSVLGTTHKGNEITLSQLIDETFSSKKLVVVTELKYKKEATFAASNYPGVFEDDIDILMFSKPKIATKQVEGVFSAFTNRKNVQVLNDFSSAEFAKLLAEVPEIRKHIVRLDKLRALQRSTVFEANFKKLGISLLTEEEEKIVNTGFSWNVSRHIEAPVIDSSKLPVLSLRLEVLLLGADELSRERCKAVNIFTEKELKELQKHVTSLRNFILK